MRAGTRISSRPIGVFDSGMGGLTVVRRMQELLPDEGIVYIADQAHVPYGGLELREIHGFATAISAALVAAGCKAVVMACNISSATALGAVQSAYPAIPVLGMIRPGAEAALARTQNGKIGVLATEGTVRSGAYTSTLRAVAPELTVIEVACPLFVPLVEAGEEASPQARYAAESYLAPLVARDVDTVVLGCTHYPFLVPVLQELQPQLTYIDPAELTVRTLADLLSRRHMRAPALAFGQHIPHLLTTGDRTAYAAQLRRFLPESAAIACIQQALWRDGELRLPDLGH